MTSDTRECLSCGSTPADRLRERPPESDDLRICPHCAAHKCILCDMGDDAECMSCLEE
jgi:hypothetical protein